MPSRSGGGLAGFKYQVPNKGPRPHRVLESVKPEFAMGRSLSRSNSRGVGGGRAGSSSMRLDTGRPTPQTRTEPGSGQGAGRKAINKVTGAAEGFMDPESEFQKRLMERVRREAGAQSAAKQRSAALRAAHAGFGAGASPEMMAISESLGREGVEAGGRAATDASLGAIGMGFQGLQNTMSPSLAADQMEMQESQFNADLLERARQSNMGAGINLQQMLLQRDLQEAQLRQQQEQQQIEQLLSLMGGVF